MTIFPTARTTRPADPLSTAARTLTDVLGGESSHLGPRPPRRRRPDRVRAHLAAPARRVRADVELWLITWPVGHEHRLARPRLGQRRVHGRCAAA